MVERVTSAGVRDVGNGSNSGREGRGRLRHFLSTRFGLRVLVYGALLVFWQITATIKGGIFLPGIPETLLGIGTVFSEGYYLTLLETLQQLIVGFGLALIVAIPVGALMGRFRIAEDFFGPYVNTLYVTSKESLLPLLLIIFGTGLGYRIAVVVMFALFFPIMNTAAGVRFVDKEFTETARAFCTPGMRMFRAVYLPAAAPFVIAGIRLGLGMALKGMVIAELWVTIGTGELLKNFGTFRRLDLFYALVLMILAIGIVTNEGLRYLERKLRPWRLVEDVGTL